MECTPPPFDRLANKLYQEQLGSPVVKAATFWEIYTALLNCFQESETTAGLELDTVLQTLNREANESIDLMENQSEGQIDNLAHHRREEAEDKDVDLDEQYEDGGVDEYVDPRAFVEYAIFTELEGDKQKEEDVANSLLL